MKSDTEHGLWWFLRIVVILMLLIAIVSIVEPVNASDTSDSEYYGTIRVSNNSTATTNVATTISGINTTNLINGGYLNSSANNCAIQRSGSRVAFMPGVGTNPWILFEPSIGTDTYQDDIFYNNATGGTLAYFPDASGMDVGNPASINITDNGSVSINAFITTDNGSFKDIIGKNGAFRLYVSSTVSGNVTGAIYDGDGWHYPSSASGWTDNENICDNSTATYAYTTLPSGGWTGFITAVIPEIQATGVRYWYSSVTKDPETVDLDVYYNGIWNDQWTGVPGSEGQWNYGVFTANDVTGIRIRFQDTDDTGDGTLRLYGLEIDGYHTEYAEASISATDLSDGDYDFLFTINDTFIGLGTDSDISITMPSVTDNLSFNLPLWFTRYNGSSFVSTDSNNITVTNTGAVWTSQGRQYSGAHYQTWTATPDMTMVDGQEWTWAGWLYTTKSTWTGFASSDGSDGLELHNNDRIYFDNTSDLVVIGSYVNTWTHIGVSCNGSALLVYKDGTYINAMTPAGGTAFTFSRLGQGIGEFYQGIIGECQFYDKALSASEVSQLFAETQWRYTGSYTDDDLNYIYAPSVIPTSSDNWTVGSATTVYIESAAISINGTIHGSWQWEYDTTFTDLSGNGNDGIPSFRTTSTDPDVSATLVDFQPIEEADAPAYTITSPTDWVSGNTTVTENFTTTIAPTYPGSDILSEAATAGSTPVQLPTLIIASVFMLGLSYTSTHFLKKYNTLSLAVQLFIITAGLGILVAVHVIDNWMLWLFLMIGTAIAMMSTRIGFAGTGTTGNNLVGFLFMSFFGMTLVNRILEGRFLQTADINIINDVLVFQPFSVFGWFTIPVPNVSFLTNGIPAIVRWDYSFFGGDAQLIQYMLYSVTAVLSFILFVLALGAAYQMFSRGR